MADESTYENRFGPFFRRVQRIARRTRWAIKGVLGIRREILVEVRWRLGDEIMALPIYAALKRAYPDDNLGVWCTYPELLEGNAAVDSRNAEAVFPDRYILLRSAARDTHRIEHYARIAGVETPAQRPEVRAPDELPGDWNTPPGRRVAIAPGATWPVKRWPLARWQSLCEFLAAEGCEFVVLGSAGEGVGAGRDLTGGTSVSDCARILASADVCVCSDSGLMHLALAVGTPVIALFGPTNPAILIRDDPRLHGFTNERECRFCWNDSQEMIEPGLCPRGIAECLGTIDPGTIARGVLEVLSRGRQELARRL